MYKILEQGERVSIVIEDGAQNFSPLAMAGNIIYNPDNDWIPVVGARVRRMNKDLIEEAKRLIEKAKRVWNPPVPQDMLSSLIAKSVAEVSAELAARSAMPLIDQFIKETYGLIPKVLEVKTPKNKNKVVGVTHERFEDVMNLVFNDIPVFLTGPAGSGKNVLCKQVAESIGLEFYFSNAVTQEYKITGFIDANGRYQETQFYKAFTGGGVFMLDEIDASTPEVLVILNAAIANRYFDFPTGRVDAHEDFRIIAAGNTFGTGADMEYTGRYQLDASSLDRFAIIEIDYSKNIEEAIANGNDDLLNFVREFRRAIQKQGQKFIVSYRAIDRLQKLHDVFPIDQAIQMCLLRSMGIDDAKISLNHMSKMSNNKYFDSFKEICENG